jgi:hypothetical protein
MPFLGIDARPENFLETVIVIVAAAASYRLRIWPYPLQVHGVFTF